MKQIPQPPKFMNSQPKFMKARARCINCNERSSLNRSWWNGRQHVKICSVFGYSRKKPNRGGWGHTFLKLLWNFEFFNFTPGNSRPNKVSPLENPQIMLDPLEISRPETKTPGNSTLFFLGQPRKFHVFN